LRIEHLPDHVLAHPQTGTLQVGQGLAIASSTIQVFDRLGSEVSPLDASGERRIRGVRDFRNSISNCLSQLRSAEMGRSGWSMQRCAFDVLPPEIELSCPRTRQLLVWLVAPYPKRPLTFRGLLTATDPFRSLNFTNFRRPVLPLLRTFALHGGDACFVVEPTSPPPLMPAHAPPLWEMQGVTLSEDEAPPQPVPDYQFDQRIAWQRPHEDDPIRLVRVRLHHGSLRRPRRPPRRPMAILVLRFCRGFQAPSARFPRLTTAVRAYQSLEHLRKWR